MRLRVLLRAGLACSSVSFLLVAAVPGAAQPFQIGLAIHTPAPTTPGDIAVADLNGDGKLDLVVANPLLASVSVQLGDGGGGFGARKDYAVGFDPRALALGDLNGDGRLDLVSANASAHTVTVLFGKPLGEFGTRADYPTGTAPRALAIGDVNDDSKLDVVVANAAASTVSVLKGTGTGALGPKTDFATDIEPGDVALADVNADGWLDVLTANLGGMSVSRLLGDGTGTFGSLQNFEQGVPLKALTLGDLDGDGDLDLASLDDLGQVNVRAGDGAGGFGSPVGDVLAYGERVALADVDSDGDADLVAVSSAQPWVAIKTGNGNGTFGDLFVVPIPGSGRSLEIADVDGDGGLDFIVALAASSQIVVLRAKAVSLFGPGVDHATGDYPTPVVLADVSSDGILDAITACYSSNGVSVLLGNGTGGFGAKTDYATGGGASGLAVGDVNGDGKPDLAVANQGAGTLSVLLGTGTGTFGAKTDHPAGSQPTNVALGDVTGDGKPDLVVTDWGDSVVYAFHGNGLGGFAPKVGHPAGAMPFDVEIGDLDHDGVADLIVTNAMFGEAGRMSILLGTGGGAFNPPFPSPAGNLPFAAVLADVNEDGDLDVVVCNYGSDFLTIYLGNGAGDIEWQQNSPIDDTGANALAAGDLDGDGRLDIAVPIHGTVVLGDGGGGFGPPIVHPAGVEPGGVALGDLDGNGRLDLVVANSGDDDLRVWLDRSFTRTQLTTSPEPVALGQPLTLTATISTLPAAPGSPGGLVRFFDGFTPLGSVAPVGNTASLTLPAPYPWHRTFRATYLGDPGRQGSIAAPVSNMVYIATVDAPAAEPLRFALEGTQPNPSAGRLAARFVLATSAAARLELFDVRGRRLAQREVGDLGPGRHVVELANRRSLAPGIYLVRLSQGANVATARAVVLGGS